VKINRGLYQFVRSVLLGLLVPYTRLRVEGREHLPASGAFVLAPVHRSFADFALVSAVTSRPMAFMAKDSLWNNRLLGGFLDRVGAFPVHRGSVDRNALRRSIEALGAGVPLVIFPEGTRRSGPVVEDLFEGAAYVAARAGVPLVPVGIGGSERMMEKGRKLPRPSKVRVVVGAPIDRAGNAGDGRASRADVHATTERLQQRLQGLFDDAQERAGASA
jgi:1-acyl-sn-glycerol-3-phosphate acyltransferase